MEMSAARYTTTAKILHWLIALTIFALFALGWFMTDLPRETPDRAFYFNLHKSIGVTLFALVLFRLFWRIGHKPPALVSTLKAWERKLANAGHHSLYLLMVLVPVSGLVMSAFSKFGVKWFGLPLIPGLDDKALRDVFTEVHEVVGLILLAVIIVHVLGALKHHFLDKDETLKRML